jgi:hypothetical protein
MNASEKYFTEKENTQTMVFAAWESDFPIRRWTLWKLPATL